LYTTQYVFLFTIGFFVVIIRIISFLNLHIKYIDILLTIPIIIIASVLLFILGFFAIIIIAIYPKSVYRIGYILALIILFVLGVNLKFEGESTPKNKQFIRVLNHTSFVDELLVAVAMGIKPWTIIYAEEIKRIPFLGKMLRDYGIPVNRDEKESGTEAFLQSKNAIESGKNFALFAEGKRLRPNDFKDGLVLYPFKSGAFSLACKYNLPIYPVVFIFPFLYKPRSGQWWFSPRTITVINLDPIFTEGKNSKQVASEVHFAMEETIRFYLNK
jgi:1-acyl-sn-glycerol-3-phosphate acyltransferase